MKHTSFGIETTDLRSRGSSRPPPTVGWAVETVQGEPLDPQDAGFSPYVRGRSAVTDGPGRGATGRARGNNMDMRSLQRESCRIWMTGPIWASIFYTHSFRPDRIALARLLSPKSNAPPPQRGITWPTSFTQNASPRPRAIPPCPWCRTISASRPPGVRATGFPPRRCGSLGQVQRRG